MEQIISFILALNKLTLISFFITLLLLIYQIYLFKKEIKKKKKKIVIPEFNENLNQLEMDKDSSFSIKKNNNLIFYRDFFINKVLIIFIIFVIFLSIFIFSLLTKDNQSTSANQSSNLTVEEKPKIVFYKIKIYNEDWKELTEEEIKKIPPGKKIIIGVETTDDLNIDMARIKINQGQWDQSSLTTKFNDKEKVFYREYQLATGDSFLKIEAQLHSKVDGWLGD